MKKRCLNMDNDKNLLEYGQLQIFVEIWTRKNFVGTWTITKYC